MKKRSLAALLLILSLLLTACGSGLESQDLMADVTPRKVDACFEDDFTQGREAYLDFSVRLLRQSFENENTLLSPLSVWSALAMTANGAEGETLAEMETVLGLSRDKLNTWLHSFLSEDRDALHLANAIWFTDHSRFTVNRDFLQINADYYGADICQAPFDDTTLRDINRWVSDQTDGMIPSILDSMNSDAVMYLVNALAFEAEWDTIYRADQIRERNFTLEDGTTRTVEFMYSEEGRYLANDLATGFVKYYKDDDYAFVALLPREGLTMAEFLDTISGGYLRSVLAGYAGDSVNVSIPKFETESALDLAGTLQDMGMPLAFDEDLADFSGLGTSSGNISISRVLHRTYINVDARGTKAGAAAAVEATDAAAPMEPSTVYLNRPFVYMLIDCETNIPFFIGCMMEPQ